MEAKPIDDLDALWAALGRCAFVELAYDPQRPGRPYRATLTLRAEGPGSEAEGVSLHAALVEALASLPARESEQGTAVPPDPDPEMTAAELHRALRACAHLETSFFGGTGWLHPFQVRLIHEDQRSGLGAGPTLRAALLEAFAEYRPLDGELDG